MTGEMLTFLVSEDQQGERLDRFLADELSDNFSRERLQALIAGGALTVDGKVQTKVAYRLQEGQSLCLQVPEPQPIHLLPEDLPVEIIYEDEHLLVVNKPVGMLTHPAGSQLTGTLVNIMLHHCLVKGNGGLSGINGQLRPGIVHRLDKDTSGLLMVAKTELAHRVLSEQLKAKTARREYRAIVQGVFKTDSGTVDAAIGRHPKHREKQAIVTDGSGRSAVTHWAVQERFGNFAYIICKLETGRTHQIRVHMASIKHPLVGDLQYGSGVEKQLRLVTKGQLLQAFRLGFVHPATGEAMQFEIPESAEIAEALVFFRHYAAG